MTMSRRRHSRSRWGYTNKSNIGKYQMFYFVLISLFIKSFLFLGLVSNSAAYRIDFTNAFFGFPPVLVYMAFELILLSFTFLFKGKGRIIYPVIVDFFVSIIHIANLCYYRAFSNFLSLHLLSMLANTGGLEDGILSLLRSIDTIFLLDIPVLIFFAFRKRQYAKDGQRRLGIFAALIILSLAYLGGVHIFDSMQGKNFFFGNERPANPRETVFKLSLTGYHIYDAYALINDNKPYVLRDDQKKEIDGWFKAKKENLPDNEYKGIFKGKNLILIQVESLEKFIINQKINDQEITPTINSMLKNSIYFTNIYEQVYNGNSSDADLMANTSLYPARTGSTFFRYPHNKYNSMPMMLKSLGYTTLAIHPDKGSYWNWMPALSSMEFDRCIDESFYKMDELIGLGLSDGSYFKQISPIITAQKQPFYTFLVTLSSHMPFNIPEQYRELSLSSSLDSTRLGGYFQSFRYTDKQIGLLISNIERAGLLDNTIIVIYGDHTGVHKYYNEEIKSITPNESWWMEGQRQIPLIIYSKGMEGRMVDTIGGQIDMLPTICYLMGVDENAYENTAIGRNLLKTRRNFAVLANMEYIGNGSIDERNWAVKGIEISDRIIRSNYFK